ncbi:MAG: hypothetical protein Q4F72_08220 [Desulfovibrionaceae bacterium]|nr:hypothetical protein [Desulfovibrionaceae bacterium]
METMIGLPRTADALRRFGFLTPEDEANALRLMLTLTARVRHPELKMPVPLFVVSAEGGRSGCCNFSDALYCEFLYRMVYVLRWSFERAPYDPNLEHVFSLRDTMAERRALARAAVLENIDLAVIRARPMAQIRDSGLWAELCARPFFCRTLFMVKGCGLRIAKRSAWPFLPIRFPKFDSAEGTAPGTWPGWPKSAWSSSPCSPPSLRTACRRGTAAPGADCFSGRRWWSGRRARPCSPQAEPGLPAFRPGVGPFHSAGYVRSNKKSGRAERKSPEDGTKVGQNGTGEAAAQDAACLSPTLAGQT